MEVQGLIKEIFDTKQYGNNGFQKRQVVITTQEQYPQPLIIDFIQDKTGLLDAFQKGELVNISINLRGREWTSPQGEVKYFVSIQGWRIQRVNEQPNTGNTPPPEDFEPLQSGNFGTDDEDDDLPF